jgi:hypothetical protein
VLAQAGAEVREGLLETDLRRVQFAHGSGQAVLGEVLRYYLTCPRDQLHSAHRRLVVPIGKHVQVRVGHTLAIDQARLLGETAEGELALAHERTKRRPEWLVAP